MKKYRDLTVNKVETSLLICVKLGAVAFGKALDLEVRFPIRVQLRSK